jgi:hypothetical protein
MRVCGFTFVRNAVRFDYPFVESVRSVLPLCDEFVVAVGRSDDETLGIAHSLEREAGGTLKIIETVWDDSLREGGQVLAQQTDLALAAIRGRGFEWAIYIQADEVLHEDDYPTLEAAMERQRDDPAVEGLVLDYIHFCGSYGWIGAGRDWYRSEVRVVRPDLPGLASWKDAQGFRAGGHKLVVRRSGASVYHYGWVKPPAVQQAKLRSFHKLWHPDDQVESIAGGGAEYDYSTRGRLVPFRGTHPAVMQDRITSQDWTFDYDPRRARIATAHRVLDWVESHTGTRLGEYRNFRLI